MKITPQLICDIIWKTTKISKEQIWIYNQRRPIPEDKKLYIVVGLVSAKPYANMIRQVSTPSGMNDAISDYAQELISIDLFSYTTEAVEQYPKILASLRSTYSQQQQEALGLKIAEIPLSVNNVSEIEGAAILYRIAITLNVLRKYDTIFTTQYYDDFTLDDILTET
jgi:hypothetical protein